jgi:glycosyltransferase involved in cell wall biosynthesis
LAASIWQAAVPVHVGLNLVFLVPGYTGGTETYARELIPALVARAPRVRFTAFINREAESMRDGPWGELVPAVTVPVRASNRLEWVRGEQQLLPRLAARAEVDLVHSLANTAPGRGRFRRVVTIHDLHYRLVPEAHLGLLGLGMRVLVPLAARQSDRVIVPAASTRDDVHRLLGIAMGTIDVVPEGLGTPPAVDPLPQSEVRAELGAGDRPIVLSVSAKRPHKNLARLIGAVASIPAAHRPVLVIPGYSTRHENELRDRAAELGIADDVRMLGWVPPEVLEGLYAAAACLVIPSLHEGFGLPVLEAMARGVPVACSDRGALREVAGDAALRFDPESEAEIGAAIERLIGDRSEADRLRTAGLARSAQFSWSASAAGTLACYQRVLG